MAERDGAGSAGRAGRARGIPGEVLSGMYLSTEESRCDVENRLFTNPGTAGFPKTVDVAVVATRHATGALAPGDAPCCR